MPYNLLSEPIRKYIREQRWEQFRPIQAAAIKYILESDNNYILASKTASGKTEAAFLPILSKVNFSETGVQVLYISPLIALINDQFYRVEKLCEHLDVKVTKWHGEAKRSQKERLLKDTSGVVLITPESIEAMFVNKPYDAKQLFANLKYVIIDEIHSFIGSDRGVQLKSLLHRLQEINTSQFSIIGLSATIGDYSEAKDFTGRPDNTKVLLDRSAKDIDAYFRYFASHASELPLPLMKDLYLESCNSKCLIFPNSRGKVEEVAVKLLKISNRVGGHTNYFSHHSSINKDTREYIEYFAKNSVRHHFSIACTSTLELGIDIGSVDKVIQIDATNSISSLIQRVGRSGRKDNKPSNLILYATTPWGLTQAVACWELHQEGVIEHPDIVQRPYDILLHQTLSIVKSFSGIQYNELCKRLKSNFAFKNIAIEEIEEIIQHLISVDILEHIQSEIIIGVTGEYIVNSRDFYTVFTSTESFKVINNSNIIGDVPFSPQIIEGENLFLSARVWTIMNIDIQHCRIEVVAANDGKKPMYFGSGGNIDTIIREKMFNILISSQKFDYLDDTSALELTELRKLFSPFVIDPEHHRPLVINSDLKCSLYTFAGTKTNRAISYLFKLQGISNTIDESSSKIEIDILADNLVKIWSKFPSYIKSIDKKLEVLIEKAPNIMDFSKWGVHLPMNYKIDLLKHKYYDFESASQFFSKYTLVQND